ncbi:hypothetical protein AKO1_003838 [Acrasis kona]|uniref:Uncharacterized protein n=1 Tax=Acrasis kona TaxID=1008807 RepID=A0AAW2YXA8_9EUKA
MNWEKSCTFKMIDFAEDQMTFQLSNEAWGKSRPIEVVVLFQKGLENFLGEPNYYVLKSASVQKKEPQNKLYDQAVEDIILPYNSIESDSCISDEPGAKRIKLEDVINTFKVVQQNNGGGSQSGGAVQQSWNKAYNE